MLRVEAKLRIGTAELQTSCCWVRTAEDDGPGCCNLLQNGTMTKPTHLVGWNMSNPPISMASWSMSYHIPNPSQIHPRSYSDIVKSDHPCLDAKAIIMPSFFMVKLLMFIHFSGCLMLKSLEKTIRGKKDDNVGYVNDTCPDSWNPKFFIFPRFCGYLALLVSSFHCLLS